MFNVNWTYLLEILIPPILRKPKLRAWLKLVTSQISKIYDDFVIERTWWKYNINFTGQLCYLEKKLQETFNCNEIKILDGELIQTSYLSFQSEPYLPVYATFISENEPTMTLINQSELGHNADFIVQVPYGCLNSEQIDLLKKIINEYKLFEKQYKIVENGQTIDISWGATSVS